MEIIFGLLPISILLALLGLTAYVWSIKSGQLDDLDTPPMRMLFDEESSKKPKNDKLE